MLIVVGCSNTVSEPDLTTKTLLEIYPGDIQKVDYVEIRSGSKGQLKSYTDQEKIQEWLNKVSQLKLVPDLNQEGGVGFLYSVTLFENEESKLKFTNNNVAGIHIHNEELLKEIQNLFESE